MQLKELFNEMLRISGKLFSSDSHWEELYIASSKRPEPVLERFSRLQSQAIRCRLYNLNSPSGRGVYAGMISLRVHPEDVAKANALLQNFQD